MSIASALAHINASSVAVDTALANMQAALEDASNAIRALETATEELDVAHDSAINARGEGSRGAPVLASAAMAMKSFIRPVQDHFSAAESSLKEVLILAAGYSEKAQDAIAALGM